MGFTQRREDRKENAKGYFNLNYSLRSFASLRETYSYNSVTIGALRNAKYDRTAPLLTGNL